MQALIDYLDGVSSRTALRAPAALRGARRRRYLREALYVAAALAAMFALFVATANAVAAPISLHFLGGVWTP